VNPIVLTIMLAIWQTDDARFLETIRGIPILQDEQKQGSGSLETVDPPTDPVQPKVSIELLSIKSTEPQLVRTVASVPASERYLVSESWCASCPAAKARFLASGGKPQNIVTIAGAAALGHNFSSVPHEFSVSTTATREIVQPPSYRKQWPAAITIGGSRYPSKQSVLNHLRGGGPHANKHWQEWHLESWSVEQLVALHEDDHHGVVPTFETASDDAEAIVTGADPSLDLVAEALALHLAKDTSEQLAGSLFNIEIDTPDSARLWIADLLSKQSVDFPSAGVSARWGGDRTISIGKGKLGVKPGVDMSVRKFGVSVSTTLTGATFADDLSWVTMELANAPDLTVRFK
jgi:hypothetical protein